ncbi:MAG: hypothetical protein ACJA0V_001981 [Planctomycetota bacterium]|jgi:hypothetical protein
MIPTIHQRLVDRRKEANASIKSPPNVRLWDGVPAGCNPRCHPPHGEVSRRKLDKVKARAVTGSSPGAQFTDVATTREGRLHGERLPLHNEIREPLHQLSTSGYRMIESGPLPLNLVGVEERGVWVPNLQILAGERCLAGTVGASDQNCFGNRRHQMHDIGSRRIDSGKNRTLQTPIDPSNVFG